MGCEFSELSFHSATIMHNLGISSNRWANAYSGSKKSLEEVLCEVTRFPFGIFMA